MVAEKIVEQMEEQAMFDVASENAAPAAVHIL